MIPEPTYAPTGHPITRPLSTASPSRIPSPKPSVVLTEKPIAVPTAIPSLLGPTSVPSVCMIEEEIAFEKFEGSENPVSPGWTGNLLRFESDRGFTQFLGRLFPEDLVTKNFAGIRAQTEFLKVEFDFYEIDQWFSNNLVVSIGREIIDFGEFLPNVDEGHSAGTTVNFVVLRGKWNLRVLLAKLVLRRFPIKNIMQL